MIPKVFLFLSLMAGAVGSAKTSSSKVLPSSKSYEILLSCFSELADDRLRAKVDLAVLKDIADEKFVTSQTLLEKRKITYLDTENRLMVLTLRNIPKSVRKMESNLSLQQKDEKGVLINYELTANQKKSPPQNIINELMLGASLQEDEYSFVDTKLNGISAQYRRIGKVLKEYQIEDKVKSRSLLCEVQADLGIICTCSKK